MAKIFLTGATGYVGGQVLHSIISAFPNLNAPIACLVRDDQKGEVLREKYGDRVRIVKADLEASDVIEKESSDADVVFHLASTSHAPSAKAIVQGLTKETRSKPGYWIQMSGASLFTIPEVKSQTMGHAPTTIYNDLTSTDLIHSIITSNPQRAVDNLVISQSSSSTTSIRTALIIGGLIYGPGQGPCNTRSIQAPEIARNTLTGGQGFRLGDGLNSWSHVHVQDLGRLFVDLLTAAIEPKGNDGGELWNDGGIYLPETGDMTFGELSQRIAREAHAQNLIPSPEVTRVVTTTAEADEMSSHASALWGTNAVLKSRRAQEKLGWTPVGPALADTIADVVRVEAERMKK